MSKEINWEVDRKFRESIERGIERVRQLNKKVSEGFEKSVRRQKVREEVKPCPICQIGGDAMNEHKCNSCSKEFATCDCSRILWGRDKNPQATGAEADKVLACDAYEPKALRAEIEELSRGYFKGNSVNHWYTKAKCYGDMVHGAAIPLEKSGHPICSAGPDGAVGGIRRAIESLVSDRDALHAENEKLKERAQITECDLAKAVLFDGLVQERNALRAEIELKDKTIKAVANLVSDGYVDDLLLAVKENEKKGEWDPSCTKEKSDELLTAQMVAAPRTPTAILARDEIRARLAALRAENEQRKKACENGAAILIECRDEITKRDAENATLQADAAYWHRHGLALRNGASRLLRDLEKGGGRSDDNLEAAADKALKALADLRIGHSRLQKALEWYRDQVSGCRKIGQCGDAYRHRLDHDGGETARVALAAEDHLAEALAALNKACLGREQVAGPCGGSETCECGADRKECENNRQVNKVHLNHVDGE